MRSNTSPLRSRRASTVLASQQANNNHSIEDADGEEESLEVAPSSSSKKVHLNGNDENGRMAMGMSPGPFVKGVSTSPSLSPVTMSPSPPPPATSKLELVEINPLPEAVVNQAAPSPKAEAEEEATTVSMVVEEEDKQEKQADKEEEQHTALDICPVCHNVPEEQRKRKSTSKESWVACERCEQWFHWHCIKQDLPEGTVASDLETWYCKKCITESTEDPNREALAVKFKETKRKSARKKADVDYASPEPQAQAGPSKPSGSKSNPWKAVAESRPLTKTHFRKMKPEQLTVDWLENDPQAFMEPIFIDHAQGLDMKVLPSDIKISEIAELVGPDKPLDVIDVASQSGLHNWTLGRWAAYYEDPKREKVRNVISLELSSSPIADRIASPQIVRQIDWVEQYWPADLKEQGIYPQVTKYCLMSPGESWTDWHIDFSASSVFYHILRGRKVFYFISPTPDNLRKYEIWSGSAERQSGTWLGDECDRVYRVELKPGNTLIIPSGWIHCVYTPTDALVIGGNFLHSYNIATQLRVYQIELNTKVPKKFRFPYFVSMVWYVGWHYYQVLRREQIMRTLPGTEAVSRRILDGLKCMAAFLIEQTYRIQDGAKGVSAERRRLANENIPWQLIEDPTQMAFDLQQITYVALGQQDQIPALPEDGIPKFSAADWITAAPYDFLHDQYGPNATPGRPSLPKTNGSGTAVKRKASDVGHTPTHLNGTGSINKTPKFRHFGALNGQVKTSGINGTGQGWASRPSSPAIGPPATERSGVSSFERVERQSFDPISTSSKQKRERPTINIAKTAHDFEFGLSPRSRLEEVEVKQTVHENITRKIVPGDIDGSWVVEIRKVSTTVEKMYFAPLRPTAPRPSAAQQKQVSVEVEVKTGPSSVAMNGASESAQTTGTLAPVDEGMAVDDKSHPHDEISKMLQLAESNGHGEGHEHVQPIAGGSAA